MAGKRGKGGLVGFIGGVVATVAVMFGVGEIGIGGGGEGVLDVFSTNDSQIEENQYSFAAIIEVEEDVIYVDEVVIPVEDLLATLKTVANEKVLLIDKNATHGAWTEVVEILEGLECIIQEQ